MVHNYGDGPLRIEGSRASRRERFMVADQVVDMDDGRRTRVPGVGRLAYVDAVTHRHWHYLKFDTYSLRRPDGRLARPDRKTGFCLGDRLRSPSIGPLPNRPPFGEYGESNCGYDRPDALRMSEGISVGYGDDYAPQLEGQYVDLTRLRAGRYVLVHRANADGAVREKTLRNNAASVLIDLRWRRGRPRVTLVDRCPLSATCPRLPRLTAERAERLARAAFRRAYDRRASSVQCQVGGGFGSCMGVWGNQETGTAAVRYRRARGRLYWTYTVASRGRPERSGRVAISLGPKKRVRVTRGSFPPRGQTARAARAARVGYCPIPASARG